MADLAVVEMTSIRDGPENHLSLREHLPRLHEVLRPDSRLLLIHLGAPRHQYSDALEELKRTLPPAAAAALSLVELAEEPAGYEVPTSGGRYSK